MKSLVWILGRGGFLGSHLEREMSTRKTFAVWHCPIPSFPWNDLAKLPQEFSHALRDFLGESKSHDLKHWTIVWTAGRGVIASDDALLQRETDAWKMLLAMIDDQLKNIDLPGTIFLSSSAGALYVQEDGEVTEQSVPTPLSEYGRQKLLQEKILENWLTDKKNINALIGRIASLYGKDKNIHKPQGLIAHMSRSIIQRQPVHIFVPLDTTRDYHEVSDCARDIASCLERRTRQKDPKIVTKIFASERPTTIAELISVFTRIVKQRPRLVMSSHVQGNLHGRHLRLRSTQWRDTQGPVTSLPAGIHRLYQYQLQSSAQTLHRDLQE